MMGDQPREPKGTSTGGRFARLPRPMDDDLADPAPVSPLMTTKGLAALLYRMGVTFDGLNTSRMATEEFSAPAIRRSSDHATTTRSCRICGTRPNTRSATITTWNRSTWTGCGASTRP